MVDVENAFAASIANPNDICRQVKFPTIEFTSPTTSDDDSTLGESTIYTSFTGNMTVTEDVIRSIQRPGAKRIAPSKETKEKTDTKRKKKSKKKSPGDKTKQKSSKAKKMSKTKSNKKNAKIGKHNSKSKKSLDIIQEDTSR